MPYIKTCHLKCDLFVVNAVSLLLAGLIILNRSGGLQALRVVLGLSVVLFSPGYALVIALFPGRKALSGPERLALSFGLSLAVVPLFGLALNYTPWGIRLGPVLLTLVIFTFLMSVAAFRRRQLAGPEVFYPVFTCSVPRWPELGRLDRFLAVGLAAAVLFALGSVVYLVNTPKEGEQFTEFSILGPGGKAADYPRNLAPGQSGRVLVDVVNHEYAPVTYYVEVTAGGYVKDRTDPFRLGEGQKWEQSVSFALQKPRRNLEVRFLLFRQGDAAPYRSTHLWVNVAASSP